MHTADRTQLGQDLSLLSDPGLTCNIISMMLMPAGRSDPFVEISRLQAGDADTGSWLPVLRTETKDNNLNPVWDPITVKGTVLNNGDPYRPLRLKVCALVCQGCVHGLALATGLYCDCHTSSKTHMHASCWCCNRMRS